MPSPVVTDQLEARIRRVQSALGLDPDGVIGPDTLSALEARLNITVRPADSSLECSRTSLEEIVKFEVSSKPFYEKKLQRPVWPGGESGVTIGIGYDLGMTSRAQIHADWDGEIDDADLAALLVAQGITGEPAKKLAHSLSAVSIPYDVACGVFYRKTMPRYARSTRSTYPGVEKLPADAQGMLLSLIYNRGSKLTGPARTEMAALVPLVKRGADELDAMAAQFESMVRLWPTLPGLQKRRRREAEVLRAADRDYTPDELVRV
jgi:hypothetical protein